MLIIHTSIVSLLKNLHLAPKKLNIYAGTALLVIAVYFMGYVVPREDFTLEISCLALGIAGFTLLLKESNSNNFFYFGLGVRILLLFSTPILSDDYFRFLWDGFLTSQGINPFEFKPNELIEIYKNNEFATTLFKGMNSPDYFSIYPPVNQWLFYLAALPGNIFPGILMLRIVIIGFEIGTFFTIKEILKRYKISSNRIYFYWLNPIVILEITGNLHAEGILIFFLLSGLFALTKLKDLKGGLLLGLSFCSKLFSLMILPLVVLKGGPHRWQKLALGFIPIILLSFLPFLNLDNLLNISESLTLYFKTFEFNGSVFNLVKWIGFELKGYDIIQTAGPILSIISSIIILIISWKYRFRNRKVIFTGLTLIISSYFFFSPIVHPWYLIIPLTLSLFTPLRFPFVWSTVAFLSYSFYDNSLPPNLVNALFVIEYLLVGLFLILDLKRIKAIL